MPGGGDKLQGIKRGIVEMADIICINKADGERLKLANTSKKEFRNALHLFPKKENKWMPQVLLCSGLSGMGTKEVWQQINSYFTSIESNHFLIENRQQKAKHWLKSSLESSLLN